MSSPANAAAFRAALSSFATGVTVITTLGEEGELIGNTVNSFNSVSLDPPLVLWSLARNAFSFRAYEKSEYFAVNVLREGDDGLSHRFSRSSSHKWQDIDHIRGETGCPVLPAALAVFECRKTGIYEGGDHAIFLGEVLKFEHDPKGKPLVFWRGSYHRTVS